MPEPLNPPNPTPDYRREVREGDSDVVRLIIARFNDVMVQIEDVRDRQDVTNAHLEKLNGRTRAVETDVTRGKTVVAALMFLVTLSGVGIAAMNFLKVDLADLAKLVGA